MLLPRTLAKPSLNAILDNVQESMGSDSRGWQWLSSVRSDVNLALDGSQSPQSSAEAIDYKLAMMHGEIERTRGLESVILACNAAAAVRTILANCQ